MNEKIDTRGLTTPADDFKSSGLEAKPQGSDLDRFVATGEKLLAQQRQRLLERESAFEIERATLLDRYRVRMAELATEAQEALRSLERRRASEIAGLRTFVGKLTAMRDA